MTKILTEWDILQKKQQCPLLHKLCDGEAVSTIQMKVKNVTTTLVSPNYLKAYFAYCLSIAFYLGFGLTTIILCLRSTTHPTPVCQLYIRPAHPACSIPLERNPDPLPAPNHKSTLNCQSESCFLGPLIATNLTIITFINNKNYFRISINVSTAGMGQSNLCQY